MIYSGTFLENVGYVYTYDWQTSTFVRSEADALLIVIETAPDGTTFILTAYPIL